MKSIYVTSIDWYSGKTAVCLGLGRRLQQDGYKVGYLKPISLQPRIVEGHLADADAAFVKQTLNLEAAPWELSPITVTNDLIREQINNADNTRWIEKINTAMEEASAGKDVLLVEGADSLREGKFMNLSAPELIDRQDCAVLQIIRYRDDMQVFDDPLVSYERFGNKLAGILINRVPAQAYPFITQTAASYLENLSIPVFGVMPETHALKTMTVEEIIQALDADVLTKYYRPQALVESVVVGAMTAENALSRFRLHSHKAVITGGDRTDLQLVALETSTTCLVLTGNIHPSPLVVRQAEEFGVAILLARANTMEAVRKVQKIYGKTRLGQDAKLRQFEALMEKHMDYIRFYKTIGLV